MPPTFLTYPPGCLGRTPPDPVLYRAISEGRYRRKVRPKIGLEDRGYVPAALRHWRKVHNLTARQAQARIGYCNPPDAPIWMADLTFKTLGDIEVDDVVVGWGPSTDRAAGSGPAPAEGTRTWNARTLMPATVLAISETHQPMVRVSFESGRCIRCTPTHLWLQHYGQNGGRSFANGVRGADAFGEAAAGRVLCHVVDLPEPVMLEHQRTAGWLAGIADGEASFDGSTIAIAQSRRHNPDVFAGITSALDVLGFSYATYENGGSKADTICVRGGRQAIVDFVNRVRPIRREKLIAGALGRHFRHPDRVLSVEPDGDDVALGLMTTTGNYVAWGFASKNSPRSCSWNHWESGFVAPPYRTLLAILAATGLGYWVDDERAAGLGALLLDQRRAQYQQTVRRRAVRRSGQASAPARWEHRASEPAVTCPSMRARDQ
jgi:hypothetical protein